MALLLLLIVFVAIDSERPHSHWSYGRDYRSVGPPTRPTTAYPWWSVPGARADDEPDHILLPEVPFQDQADHERNIGQFARSFGWDTRRLVLGWLPMTGLLRFDVIRGEDWRSLGEQLGITLARRGAPSASAVSPDSPDSTSAGLASFATQACEHSVETFVRVDRRRPWRDVEDLIAAIADVGRADVCFAVDGRCDCRDLGLRVFVEHRMKVSGALARSNGETQPVESHPVPVAIDLVLDGTDGTEVLRPRVRIGDHSWTFPGGDPYATPTIVEAANDSWRGVATEIEAALAQLSKEAHETGPKYYLSLDIDPRVPWSHVAQFVGIGEHVAQWAEVGGHVCGGEFRVPGRRLEFSYLGWYWRDPFPFPAIDRPECDLRRLFDPPDRNSFVTIGIGAFLAVGLMTGLRFIGRRRPRRAS